MKLFSIQQDLTEMPTAILAPSGKYKSIGPEWKQHATGEPTLELSYVAPKSVLQRLK